MLLQGPGSGRPAPYGAGAGGAGVIEAKLTQVRAEGLVRALLVPGAASRPPKRQIFAIIGVGPPSGGKNVAMLCHDYSCDPTDAQLANPKQLAVFALPTAGRGPEVSPGAAAAVDAATAAGCPRVPLHPPRVAPCRLAPSGPSYGTSRGKIVRRWRRA